MVGWGLFGSGGGGVLGPTLGRPGLGAGKGFLVTLGLVTVTEPDDVSEGLDDVALLDPDAGVPANVPYFMS